MYDTEVEDMRTTMHILCSGDDCTDPGLNTTNMPTHDGCSIVALSDLVAKGSFHKAILATIDLTYLRLILRLPALIFTSI